MDQVLSVCPETINKSDLNIKKCRRTALGLSLSVIIIGTILLTNLDHVFSASSDLMLEYLTWEPEHTVFGGLLSVHGTIKNVGDTQSSDKYTLSLYVDDWRVDGWLVRLAGFQPTVSPEIAPGGTQVWHFKISDYAVFKQGDHQVKAVVTEPGDPNPDNNELVKTLSISPGDYSSDFSIVNYGMCNKIDEKDLPVGITENYSFDDELAVSYFYTDIKHADWPEKIGQESNLTFKFYNQEGFLYVERNSGYSILLARDPTGREITGFALQLSLSALDYQGAWRVEVFNEDHRILAKRFMIGDMSSRTLSTSTSTSEPASTGEQTSTTKDLVGQVPGAYMGMVGAIAVAAVGCGVILVMRRKKLEGQRRGRPSMALQWV